MILAYDPATKTVGTVTSMFDPVTKAWTPIGEVSAVKVAGETTVPQTATDGLKNFVATGYFAVTIN